MGIVFKIAGIFLIILFILAGFVIFSHLAHPITRINTGIGDKTHSDEEAFASWGGSSERVAEIRQIVDFYENTMEDVSIQSVDGIRLMGKCLVGSDPNLWVLLIHGYTATNRMMFTIADEYHKRGYSILAPDHRGHGKSNGIFSTYGVREKEDMKLWLNWIKENYPASRFILHGESMGATAAMYMVEDNPSSVIALIEDCGFISYYDLLSEQIVKYTGILTYPSVWIGNLFIMHIIKGDAFKSAVDSLRKTKIPTLFINGYKDELAPVWMTYRLYDAHPGKKDIYISPAEHAESKLVDEDAYFMRVFGFIDEVRKEKI